MESILAGDLDLAWKNEEKPSPAGKAAPRELPEAMKRAQFKPGHSGNPEGSRVRKTPLSDELKKLMGTEVPGSKGTTVAKAVANKLLQIAISNNPGRALEAMHLIFERVEGKVMQPQEISGPNGSPMQFESVANREELERRLAELFAIAERRRSERFSGGSDQEPPRMIEATIVPSRSADATPASVGIDLKW